MQVYDKSIDEQDAMVRQMAIDAETRGDVAMLLLCDLALGAGDCQNSSELTRRTARAEILRVISDSSYFCELPTRRDSVVVRLKP